MGQLWLDFVARTVFKHLYGLKLVFQLVNESINKSFKIKFKYCQVKYFAKCKTIHCNGRMIIKTNFLDRNFIVAVLSIRTESKSEWSILEFNEIVVSSCPDTWEYQEHCKPASFSITTAPRVSSSKTAKNLIVWRDFGPSKFCGAYKLLSKFLSSTTNAHLFSSKANL